MERTAIPMWLMALTGVTIPSCWLYAARWELGWGDAGTSLELDEDLPLLDGVADLDVDLGDLAGDGGRDDGLHLHGLQHQQDIVHLDRLPDLGRDLGNGA